MDFVTIGKNGNKKVDLKVHESRPLQVNNFTLYKYVFLLCFTMSRIITLSTHCCNINVSFITVDLIKPIKNLYNDT